MQIFSQRPALFFSNQQWCRSWGCSGCGRIP